MSSSYYPPPSKKPITGALANFLKKPVKKNDEKNSDGKPKPQPDRRFTGVAKQTVIGTSKSGMVVSKGGGTRDSWVKGMERRGVLNSFESKVINERGREWLAKSEGGWAGERRKRLMDNAGGLGPR